MPSHLTEFSIKQWLLQKLFTALAVLRTSQSHLETEESLCPIPLTTQLQDSKLCLDGFFSSPDSRSTSSCKSTTFTHVSNCSNLLAIEGAGDSKGSFHTPLEGCKERQITFNCKIISVSYSSCLSANEAEARLSSSDGGG